MRVGDVDSQVLPQAPDIQANGEPPLGEWQTEPHFEISGRRRPTAPGGRYHPAAKTHAEKLAAFAGHPHDLLNSNDVLAHRHLGDGGVGHERSTAAVIAELEGESQGWRLLLRLERVTHRHALSGCVGGLERQPSELGSNRQAILAQASRPEPGHVGHAVTLRGHGIDVDSL